MRRRNPGGARPLVGLALVAIAAGALLFSIARGGPPPESWSGHVDQEDKTCNSFARFAHSPRQQTRTIKEPEMNTKGAMIAAAVAGMFMSASPVTAAEKAAGGKIHCAGVNSCKGKGDCHSADNGCKSQNGCKGKGWIELGEKACKAKGGTVAAPMEKPDKK